MFFRISNDDLSDNADKYSLSDNGSIYSLSDMEYLSSTECNADKQRHVIG